MAPDLVARAIVAVEAYAIAIDTARRGERRARRIGERRLVQIARHRRLRDHRHRFAVHLHRRQRRAVRLLQHREGIGRAAHVRIIEDIFDAAGATDIGLQRCAERILLARARILQAAGLEDVVDIAEMLAVRVAEGRLIPMISPGSIEPRAFHWP